MIFKAIFNAIFNMIFNTFFNMIFNMNSSRISYIIDMYSTRLHVLNQTIDMKKCITTCTYILSHGVSCTTLVTVIFKKYINLQLIATALYIFWNMILNMNSSRNNITAKQFGSFNFYIISFC